MDKRTSAYHFAKAILGQWIVASTGGVGLLGTFFSAVFGWVPLTYVLALVSLLAFAVACYRAWRDERNSAIALQDRVRPIIDVFLDPTTSGVRKAKTKDSAGEVHESLWVQISVRSKSDVPLENCMVRVLSIEGLETPPFKYDEPMACQWAMSADQRTDIPAGVTIAANILTYYPDKNRLLPVFSPHSVGLETDLQTDNAFRIHLAVTAKDAMTEQRVATVNWRSENLSVQLK